MNCSRHYSNVEECTLDAFVCCECGCGWYVFVHIPNPVLLTMHKISEMWLKHTMEFLHFSAPLELFRMELPKHWREKMFEQKGIYREIQFYFRCNCCYLFDKTDLADSLYFKKWKKNQPKNTVWTQRLRPAIPNPLKFEMWISNGQTMHVFIEQVHRHTAYSFRFSCFSIYFLFLLNQSNVWLWTNCSVCSSYVAVLNKNTYHCFFTWQHDVCVCGCKWYCYGCSGKRDVLYVCDRLLVGATVW